MEICTVKYIIILSLFSLSLIGQSSDFELLSNKETGITFSNNLKANLETSENLFDYDYFYNGAGVGIIDVNNDGLQDIYFASNQEMDKLYLNLGDFKFRDITSEAFGNFQTQWSTGVSITDVNQDGWLDIYVCQSGARHAESRQNLLFINNGNQTFTERASNYGLNDTGMSTQALFFDYDKDGDLDCFVMNESLAYGLDPVSFTRLNLEQKPRLYESFSHFYHNDNGLFVDKTKELGLDHPTFGLGIKSGDINQDGWEDIYVSNDYYVPDMLYINNKGKGFVNQIKTRTKQMSFYGMGMDIADINNDGYNDIFVLDMASGDHYRSKTLMRSMNVENFRLLTEGLQFPNQYMFNSLQLNNGNGTYKNLSQIAGVSSTDWSWSVLIEDFDFDGLKDIHITNGYRKYALDNDFQNKVKEKKKLHKNKVPLGIKKQLYAEMPTEKLSNIFYKNIGNLKFENWSIDEDDNPPSYSNGAAIADFDNDGDPDIIINNMDEEASLYKNLAVEKGKHNFLKIKSSDSVSHRVKRVAIHTPSRKLTFDPRRVRGYMSSSEPSVFSGLADENKIDSVIVFLDNNQQLCLENVSINSTIILSDFSSDPCSTIFKFNNEKEENTLFKKIIPSILGLDFHHKENNYDDFEKEILLPYKQSTLGPFINTADVNNDGLQDLVISNSIGSTVSIYYQNKTGFENYSIPLELNTVEKEFGKIELTDINNDGKLDFILPAGGNEKPESDKMYESCVLISNSDSTFTHLVLPMDGSSNNILSIDYDLDGDKDLLVLGRHIPQKYPKHAPSRLYENQLGTFKDVTDRVFPELLDFGIINDAEITDINNDGWPDVVIVGEWTGIGVFENTNANFKDVQKKYNIPDINGLWFSVEATDLNSDGQPDFIIGNIGQNTKFSASVSKPLRIYGSDFDNNGSWDLVLSKSYKEDYVPFRGLECSSEQMPFIKDKFKTYDLFAKATIDDVYGSALDSAYVRSVNALSSVALISQEDNRYELIELPVEAQVSPILSIELFDVNDDGQKEVIVSGNIYNTEVETPRLDAGSGLVITYDKNSGFKSLSLDTGLNLEGNIKSTCIIYHRGIDKQLLIATENNGELIVHAINSRH